MVEEESNMVIEANKAAERLEKANATQAELLRKIEILESRRVLGGQSMAGTSVEPPKEESPKEYAARMMRGGK